MRAAASSRRRFLVTGGGAALVAALSLQASAKDPDPACPKCRGRGVVPLVRPKPFVFLEGSGSFRPADAAFAQFCPTCQPMADKDLLIQEVARQHETVLLKHKEWEERTGWRLVLVQTRHATIHTQHQPIEARRMGQAVEALTIHLQKTTGSLELTATQPGFYQQMLLFGEDSWEKFR